MAEPRHVVVIGGGITGLATAWYLRAGAGATPPAVTVVEAGGRLGGKIRTEEVAGVPVEAGPDTFLARVPWAADLCRELGLAGDLVPPATGKAYVWTAGRLHALPRDQVLGVPTTLRALARSSMLTPAGKARLTLDLVLPRRARPPDPSVAAVISERFGTELLDRVVDPLVGGINAGRAESLSLASTARPLASSAGRHRSVILGLRRQLRSSPPPTGPMFLGVTGGLQRVIDRLAEPRHGIEIRLASAVDTIEPAGDGRWRVECAPPATAAADRSPLLADAVVVTTPAFAAATMLRRAAPAVAAGLDAINYASVVIATLAYRPPATPSYLDGSGFVVARTEGRLLTACTWTTSKWPELRRGGHILVRCSAGRAGDGRALEMDDDELTKQFHEELAEVIHVDQPPLVTHVTRWPQSFPQYEVGHEERVDAIHAGLTTAPGIYVAGAAYRGLGIAACVHQAEHAAGQVMTYLSHQAPRRQPSP